MGVRGAGLAISCTSSLNFFLLSVAARMNKDLKDMWAPLFSLESFKEMKPYLSIAIPSFFLLILSQYPLRILSFLVGYISVEALAAQTTLVTALVILIMIPFAF